MDLSVPGLPHAHLHGAVVGNVLADVHETLVCIIHSNLDIYFISCDTSIFIRIKYLIIENKNFYTTFKCYYVYFNQLVDFVGNGAQ